MAGIFHLDGTFDVVEGFRKASLICAEGRSL